MSIGAFLERRRVAVSWIFASAFLYFASPEPPFIIAGLLPMSAGAALRTWASGHIRKQESLATSGPYSCTRNPLYLGSFLVAVGALIMAGSWWLAALFACLAVPLYGTVMRREEEFLESKFDPEFTSYRKKVPLFFPRGLPTRRSGAEFRWSLVFKHREWQVWLSIPAVTLFMFIKYYWL